ncbi:MAG: TRAP transporter large permease [Betaproteobacteria bacterium]
MGWLLTGFGALVVASVPIAFALLIISLAGILVFQPHVPLTIVTNRIFGSIDSFTLLAIPFFILAGELMEIGGISNQLVELARRLVGHIRGGLGHVTVVGEVFFSGISGSTTADAAAMGSLMVPMMVKGGYEPERAAAIVCAASGMGILVPPCLGMVVYGGMTNTSIAALFAAGFLPALVMAGLLMLHIYVEARRKRVAVEPRSSLVEVLRALRSASLALMLPVIIFGGILGGIFTPTEAAVVAVVYALVLGMVVYRTVRPRHLVGVLTRTGVVTATVMFLIGTASVFSWLMTIEQVPQAIAAWIKAVGGGRNVFLLLSLITFLVLFAVFDGFPAMLMCLPIFVPMARSFGIDPVHYGIIMMAITGVALFLPPIGVGMFVVVNIARTSVWALSRALYPYIVTMFIACLIITYVPSITLFLPRLIGL